MRTKHPARTSPSVMCQMDILSSKQTTQPGRHKRPQLYFYSICKSSVLPPSTCRWNYIRLWNISEAKCCGDVVESCFRHVLTEVIGAGLLSSVEWPSSSIIVFQKGSANRCHPHLTPNVSKRYVNFIRFWLVFGMRKFWSHVTGKKMQKISSQVKVVEKIREVSSIHCCSWDPRTNQINKSAKGRGHHPHFPLDRQEWVHFQEQVHCRHQCGGLELKLRQYLPYCCPLGELLRQYCCVVLLWQAEPELEQQREVSKKSFGSPFLVVLAYQRHSRSLYPGTAGAQRRCQRTFSPDE